MPAGGQGRRMLTAARAGRRQRPFLRSRHVPGKLTTAWVHGVARLAAWWRSLKPRGRWITVSTAAAAVTATAGLLAWVVATGEPSPRARQYLSFTACLLTGPAGLADAPVKPVWAGMQAASLATRAQVEYLPVAEGSTGAAALPYLASLVQRRCRVVVAVGPAQVAAVAVDAARYPAVRFVVVGGRVAGANVRVADGTAASVRASVQRIVTAAVTRG